MHLVRGTLQHYAWGDTAALPALLGAPADGRPWAEAWFGTHHGGPAVLDDGRPLSALVGDLPYLLKLLAAAEPLSLQTHPDALTAREGFAREQANGPALDAPTRIYRDAAAKPEVLCALGPFEALCGFRPVAATLELLARLGATRLADLVGGGLAAAVRSLLRRDPDGAAAHAQLVECCTGGGPEAAMLADLARRYPGDPGVAVAALLHHVHLQPGEALYLDAGNLHAYLRGVGVEVMGPSDNVVRGGLTSKHVDVPELLRVVRFEPLADPVVVATSTTPGEFTYPTPGAPFRVTRLEIGAQGVGVVADGSELLACVAGDSGVLRTGQVGVLVDGEHVTLHGPATVFRISPAGEYRRTR